MATSVPLAVPLVLIVCVASVPFSTSQIQHQQHEAELGLQLVHNGDLVVSWRACLLCVQAVTNFPLSRYQSLLAIPSLAQPWPNQAQHILPAAGSYPTTPQQSGSPILPSATAPTLPASSSSSMHACADTLQQTALCSQAMTAPMLMPDGFVPVAQTAGFPTVPEAASHGPRYMQPMWMQQAAATHMYAAGASQSIQQDAAAQQFHSLQPPAVSTWDVLPEVCPKGRMAQ